MARAGDRSRGPARAVGPAATARHQRRAARPQEPRQTAASRADQGPRGTGPSDERARANRPARRRSCTLWTVARPVVTWGNMGSRVAGRRFDLATDFHYTGGQRPVRTG